MSWIRTEWTPHDADEWTKEDWIAIVLSSLSYIALTVGVGLSLLLLWIGYVVLALGVVFTIAMFAVIDPKLKSISSGYEKKQKEYLESLEKIIRWEETK
ncbi:MAG: hypothetical protein ONB44_23790 [candidate division KSB1 bacterium]|nr:hypothetical protein [candidate division KSB1 bacterium]MDZ7305166.1 hypothetical protein [candidate division KSB1 bacterium]MDZ7312937.1 hypothetical protein [candidate division KSB1 bacterium]